MKRIVFTFLILILGMQTYAQISVEAVRRKINELVARASIDYPDRRGAIVLDNDAQTTYAATVPYFDLNTSAQFTNVLKKTNQAFFVAVYSDDSDIEKVTAAFTDFDEKAQKDILHTFEKTNYTEKKQMQKNADAYLTDTVFYKNMPVAVLNINPDGKTAIVTIGLINSKNLAAEKAILPPMEEHPYKAGSPLENMSISGNVITVHDRGKDFDGDYNVSILAKDSCVSGNCENGKGRKVLASIVNGLPRIRIMQGRFIRNVFVGNGVMLVDGEGPATDGTYKIESFSINYTHNDIGADAVFHPKAGNEVLKGRFDGYYDGGIGAAFPQYRKFVVCKFRPRSTTGDGSWERDAYWPKEMLEHDRYKASAQYRDEEAKRLAQNAEFDAIKQRNLATDKCGCCGGKGVTTQQDFVHFAGTGNNYMRYANVKCTCCNGTGLKKDQISYKPKDNGGIIIK